MPISVRTATNNRMKPDRNWSCDCSADNQNRADGRQAHHNGDDHRAGDHRRDQVADIGDERVDGHAQRILDQQLVFLQPLGPAGRHILLVQFIEKVRPQAPDHGRRAGGSDHDGRNDQVGEHRHRLVETPGLVDVFGCHEPADGQAEPLIEQIKQDQREQEVGRRKADIAYKGKAVVAPGILPRRRIDAYRKRDHVNEENRREIEHDRSAASVGPINLFHRFVDTRKTSPNCPGSDRRIRVVRATIRSRSGSARKRAGRARTPFAGTPVWQRKSCSPDDFSAAIWLEM